mgnify:FL=1
MNPNQIEQIESILGHTFKNKALIKIALTHRSAKGENNERLEFLGDGILNFIVAELLYVRFQQLSEGDLSRLRSQLVKESTLCDIAKNLTIGDFLLLGEGELKSAGWRRPSILADSLEAIIAAIYLDDGIGKVKSFIERRFNEHIITIDPNKIHKDDKSLLQEFLQGKKIDIPEYTVIEIAGEPHAQAFEVKCRIPKLNIEKIGKGPSRKIAEQNAANLALISLGKISGS